MTLLLAIGGGVLALGALLMWLGARGRRVNDHPVCRRCGFDLAGVYPASAVCPECGRDLAGKKSVRTGVRKRWWLPLAPGIALTVMGVVAAAALAGVMMLGSSYNQKKPLWLLLFESRYGSSARVSAVGDELHRRVQLGEMTDPAEVRLAAEAALRVQADLSEPWNPKWGDVIELAHLQGAIGEKEYERFLMSAPVFEMYARPVVRHGDAVRVNVGLKEKRLGSRSMVQGTLVVKEARLGGRALEGESARFIGMDLGTSYFWLVGNDVSPRDSSLAAFSAKPSPSAGPGEHRVEMSWEARFATTPNSMALYEATGPTRQLALSARVRIAPPGEDSLEVVNDIDDVSELWVQLRGALSVGAQHDASYATSPAVTPADVTATFNMDGRPRLAGVFDVFARTGRRQWALGSITLGSTTNTWYTPAGQARDQTYVNVNARLAEFDPETVDIVLVPDLDAARETIDLVRVCGETIIIKDVRVSRELGGGDKENPMPTGLLTPWIK